MHFASAKKTPVLRPHMRRASPPPPARVSLISRNRLHCQLLPAEMTVNDFLDGQRLRGSRYAIYAVSRPARSRLAAKFDLARTNGRKPPENEHRDRLYRECPVSLLLRASSTREDRTLRCGSPRGDRISRRPARRGRNARAPPLALFQSALSTSLPSVIICRSVIFFNHRSPRRSVRALTLTDARRKDSVACRPNTLRCPPARRRGQRGAARGARVETRIPGERSDGARSRRRMGTNGWTDGRTNERTGERADGRTGGRAGGRGKLKEANRGWTTRRGDETAKG